MRTGIFFRWKKKIIHQSYEGINYDQSLVAAIFYISRNLEL